MIEKWKAVAITDAAYVAHIMPGQGTADCPPRKHHVFILSGDTGRRRYRFADGTVMESGPRDFRYLPKGCSYRLERIVPGECWIIQFSTANALRCGPFNLTVQNYGAIKDCFLEALVDVDTPLVLRGFVIRKCIYRILELLYTEDQLQHIPTQEEKLIQPAINQLQKLLYGNGKLCVPELAKLCGISETYFRRLFKAQYGVSPKAYLIGKRMDYAQDLLRSGYTVGQTAAACGYTEPCHFSREFSRYAGISPKQYQIAHQAAYKQL